MFDTSDHIFSQSIYNTVHSKEDNLDTFTDIEQVEFMEDVANSGDWRSYNYTEDLLNLEKKQSATPYCLPVEARTITSPFMVENWAKALNQHPDKTFVHYLVKGMADGFHIGFDRRVNCKSVEKNMKSALENMEPVDEYLKTELQAGRIVGPIDPAKASHLQISRFGVIPKAGQPGKWRLILDLSSPSGHSVNDGVDKSLCSLKYATVEDAVQQIIKVGKGALLAKIDIQHAYRNVPVHRDDRALLGMVWQGKLYIDTVLPFGLRSAPKIFSAIADALEWVLTKYGVTFILHYLDDYLTTGKPESKECQQNLETIQKVCNHLGVPLKLEKIEGPTTSLVFLGILIDTTKMELRLPDGKLSELRGLIMQWKMKKSCTKRELLSLIGKLAHAAKIVKPGRTFLRRMIDTAHSVTQLNHYVKLKADFASDLAWWDCFLEMWNGRRMIEVLNRSATPSVVLHTDASGSWGCGAFWMKTGRWIQCQWPQQWLTKNITVKEMLPIVLAMAMWGKLCSHQHILVYCDNMAVVEIMVTKTSRDREIMHLLRCLYFFTAIFDINLKVVHIEGKSNSIADAISRNFLQILRREAPKARVMPDQIPMPLGHLLITRQPDWTCVNWKELLRSCARQA